MLPHTAKTSHRRVVWRVQMGIAASMADGDRRTAKTSHRRVVWRKDKSSMGIGVLNAPTHRKDKSSQGSMAGGRWG